MAQAFFIFVLQRTVWPQMVSRFCCHALGVPTCAAEVLCLLLYLADKAESVGPKSKASARWEIPDELKDHATVLAESKGGRVVFIDARPQSVKERGESVLPDGATRYVGVLQADPEPQAKPVSQGVNMRVQTDFVQAADQIVQAWCADIVASQVGCQRSEVSAEEVLLLTNAVPKVAGSKKIGVSDALKTSSKADRGRLRLALNWISKKVQPRHEGSSCCAWRLARRYASQAMLPSSILR